MSFWTLIFRGLRFHARSHFGTLLGATIGSAILIGALAVGDSVRESLREMALGRLGKTEFALTSDDRFFRAKLAGDLSTTNFQTAAALQLLGTAANEEGSSRANHVQILGVENNFWKLATRNPNLLFTDENIVLNESLAAQLNAKAGETILLRVPRPSLLSRDAPISPQQDISTAFRLTIAAVLSDNELGNFNLRASQIPPQNAFVSLSFLQTKLGLDGKANLLLARSAGLSTREFAREKAARGHERSPSDELQKSYREKFQLADAELELRTLTNQNVLELRSARVFLDSPIVQAAVAASRQSAVDFSSPKQDQPRSAEAQQRGLVSTYFVNELRVGTNATPYSMVTAIGAPIVSKEMRDDEILINAWLAEDSQAKVGDELHLRYFVMGADQRLEEKTNSFRVRGVVPLSGLYADRDLMPEFPGVAKAENTDEWDAGFAIDMKKIRAKDEQYWKEHRGTPKAFVTLAAGEKMWSNRFGTFTAIRFPISEVAKIQESLRRNLDPASLGLIFQPVREQALLASSQSQDFGQLFLGFSFFLIFAALILVALLFQFSLEQRATEIGTLLALGFRAKQIRRLLLAEGAALAFLGGILGMFGGIFYARAMLLGLKTLWRDAVGTSSLQFHITPVTLVSGCVASLLVSVLTIWLSLRNQAKRPAHELLSQGAELEIADGQSPIANSGNWSKWISIFSLVGALGLVGWGIFQKENASPGLFFGAGALLLISGLAFALNIFKRLASGERAASVSLADLTLTSLGLRSCTRRRKRSLATIGLLACGSFLVVAVAANKLDSNKDSRKRSSGTGGFALIGESTLPVVQNLNTKAGRNFFGLEENDLAGVEFVPFRVRDGDEASCLNLNRAQTPRLLGVKPEMFSARTAFTFSKTLQETKNPWLLLKSAAVTDAPLQNDDAIPAIGDANSIQWALHKKVGDVIPYTDERGNKFNVRIVGALANSILQGNLIIDEVEFVKRFPSTSGYRMFLIDVPLGSEYAPSARIDSASVALSRALRDVGLELTPTEKRLAAFNAVQNTYLNTFQILGGLGLLLGSAGMGIVVLRNVLERRSELAVLLAIGFRRKDLRWLVLSEHAALLCLGVGLGVAAALVAVLPALLSPRGDLPYLSLAVTLGAVLASGMIWTWAATSLALRGELMESLRNN
ncbi:MAG: ABC transporter permease [Verrucomicrobiota bacterium]